MNIADFSEDEVQQSPQLAAFMGALRYLETSFAKIEHQSDIQKAVEAILTTVESIQSAVKCRNDSAADQYENVLREHASRTVTQEAEELILERYGSGWLTEPPLSWIDNADPVTALYNQLLTQEAEQSTSEGSDSIPAEKKYECAECSYTTKSRTQMWRHSKKSGHSQARAQKSADVKTTYRCSLCHMECAQTWNLKRHIRRHHGTSDSLSCDQCGKLFKEAEALSGHVARIHRQAKRHKCEVCNVPFASASNRLRHMRTVHQTESTLQCSDPTQESSEPRQECSESTLKSNCREKFATRQQLEQHNCQIEHPKANLSPNRQNLGIKCK